ncbi:MAG: hypothetical protein JRM80_06295 [Nitrososphaerota archaeon]|nr:hypothetical protein [Nitrososphaerota archaeon]
MVRSKSKRFGRVIFFVPVVAVLALMVIGLMSIASITTGTLVLETMSSGRYSPSIQLHATVTVGSTVRTSPFNLTLSQGSYTVVYGALAWYVTPVPRSLFLPNGKTEYAVGTYSPILRGIAITPNGLNSTDITAEHGVTPVVWVNERSAVTVLVVSGVGRIPLNPYQNYTMVFPSQGSFFFDIFNTGLNGTIHSL